MVMVRGQIEGSTGSRPGACFCRLRRAAGRLTDSRQLPPPERREGCLRGILRAREEHHRAARKTPPDGRLCSGIAMRINGLACVLFNLNSTWQEKC